MTGRYAVPRWLVALGVATLVGLSFSMSSLAIAAEGRPAKAKGAPPTTVPPATVPPTTTTTVPVTTQAWLTTPDLPLLNTPIAIPLPPLPVALPEIPLLVTNRPVAQLQQSAPLPPPPPPTAEPTAEPRSVRTPSPPVSTAPPLRTAAVTSTGGPVRGPDRDTGFGPDLKRTVKTFTIPLMLTIVVGLFLVLQTRFDRRDPKLVAAPVVDDLHSFR